MLARASVEVCSSLVWSTDHAHRGINEQVRLPPHIYVSYTYHTYIHTRGLFLRVSFYNSGLVFTYRLPVMLGYTFSTSTCLRSFVISSNDPPKKYTKRWQYTTYHTRSICLMLHQEYSYLDACFAFTILQGKYLRMYLVFKYSVTRTASNWYTCDTNHKSLIYMAYGSRCDSCHIPQGTFQACFLPSLRFVFIIIVFN